MGDLSASFALWVAVDGRNRRWEVEPTPAEPDREGALKLALDTQRDTLRLPSPNAIAQPLRFRLTLHAGG